MTDHMETNPYPVRSEHRLSFSLAPAPAGESVRRCLLATAIDSTSQSGSPPARRSGAAPPPPETYEGCLGLQHGFVDTDTISHVEQMHARLIFLYSFDARITDYHVTYIIVLPTVYNNIHMCVCVCVCVNKRTRRVQFGEVAEGAVPVCDRDQPAEHNACPPCWKQGGVDQRRCANAPFEIRRLPAP